MQLGNPLRQRAPSICILRLSAIGDVCHAVATVQAIQRHYPSANITWVVGKVEAKLLAGLPGVSLVVFNKKLGRKAFRDLKSKLQGQTFDVLLHMQVALRANLAARVIQAKRKVGFDKARSKELHSLFINERIAPQTKAHVVENFAGFARHIGVPFLMSPNEQPRWHMPISTEDSQWAKQLLQPFKDKGQQRFFVISPAASKAERNWLPDRYAAIADYASSKGFQVFLCGGKSPMEMQLSTAILQKTETKIMNMVDKTSLKQLLALLQQASLVLAPDTGPAHMAVTVGTPVIGLYGHSNPQRTGPYMYQHYVVEAYHAELKQQTGKSSAELPFGTRVKDEHIMANISLECVKTMFDYVIKKENI